MKVQPRFQGLQIVMTRQNDSVPGGNNETVSIVLTDDDKLILSHPQGPDYSGNQAQELEMPDYLVSFSKLLYNELKGMKDNAAAACSKDAILAKLRAALESTSLIDSRKDALTQTIQTRLDDWTTSDVEERVSEYCRQALQPKLEMLMSQIPALNVPAPWVDEDISVLNSVQNTMRNALEGRRNRQGAKSTFKIDDAKPWQSKKGYVLSYKHVL